MASNTSLIAETMAAGRGFAALVIGNRRAAEHFDFSPRGLVGSFIALLAVTGLDAAVPFLLGMKTGGAVFSTVTITIFLFAMQLAFTAIVLRQLDRLDGLVPYIVADNWATFFIKLAATVLLLFGVSLELMSFGVAILVIVVSINIARLIVTLSPLQIAMLLIAQLVGVGFGVLVIVSLFPAAAGQ